MTIEMIQLLVNIWAFASALIALVTVILMMVIKLLIDENVDL